MSYYLVSALDEEGDLAAWVCSGTLPPSPVTGELHWEGVFSAGIRLWMNRVRLIHLAIISLAWDNGNFPVTCRTSDNASSNRLSGRFRHETQQMKIMG